MTQYNRETLKNKETSFINRTPPFNDPLIQQTEDLEIRHDNSDSQLFGIPTVAAVSPTSANFGLDFTLNDEYNINLTTVPAIQAFVITISNLSGNQIGKLNITKLSGQSVSFGNATRFPDGGNVLIDSPKVTMSISIVKIGANHFVKAMNCEYRPIQIGNSSPQLRTSVVEIGGWDMLNDQSISVDLTSIVGVNGALNSKIISMSVAITTDTNNVIRDLSYDNDGRYEVGNVPINKSLIGLYRNSGGFSSTSYDDASINRGYITITIIID